MNDAVLMTQKFSGLAKLANIAKTDFETAAVYAATEALATAFNSCGGHFADHLLENVEKARWSICAAVGYDVANQLDKAQLLAFATSAVSTLESIVKRNS